MEPVTADTPKLPANGRSRATNLSSNATLFWRVFVPVFGTVMLSGLLLAFWLTEEEDLALPFSIWIPRAAMVLLWMTWILLVRRTIWRLKRVDADDAFIYVTNYWTTVRYPWTDVDRLEDGKRLGRPLVHLWLKGAGRFGQKITFLPGSYYREWMREHRGGA